MSRYTRTIAIVGMIVGVGLMMPDAYEFITVPRYDLTDQQRDLMNENARTGSQGLSGFEAAVAHPTGRSVYDFSSYYTEEPVVDPDPVPLGGSFVSNDSMTDALMSSGLMFDELAEGIGDFDSFTPTVKRDVAYVTYTAKFVNLYYDDRETMVLRNPDKGLFGDDGMVSAQEMRAFYADPRTVLVSLNATEEERGFSFPKSCTVELTLDGDKLVTDALDDCSWRIEADSPDELIAELTESYIG